MAGDYTVKFYGDLGNLRQFSNSIRGAFSEIRSAYRTSATGPVQSIGSPNLNTSKVTTQIDSYNRTLTQSGQVFHRYVAGWTADLQRLAVAEKNLGKGTAFSSPTGATAFGTRVNKSGRAYVSAQDLKPEYAEFFTGKYKNTIADLDKVEAAQAALIPAQKAFMQIQRDAELSALNFEAKRATAGERQIQILKERNLLVNKYNGLVGKGGGAAGFLLPTAAEQKLLANATDKRGNFFFPSSDPTKGDAAAVAHAIASQRIPGAVPHRALQGAIASVRGLDVVGNEIKKLDKEDKNLVAALKRYEAQEAAAVKKLDARRQSLLKKFGPQFRALDAALVSTPPIPKDLDTLLRESPQLQKQLSRKLGITTPYSATDPKLREDYNKQLLAKGITHEGVQVTKDFDKGISKLTLDGIRDAEGRVGSLSTSLDQNGKVLQKWSGNLRGGGGALRQTVKDFQKVIEWTIATTAVFGTLGLAFGSISKINQVNADLARFSITAQTSATETKAAFSDITQIAISTATPLQELVAVMDDIALATRRAGQTSAEWKEAMNALAQSVGILTNLTGVDTVRATDLLSSAYKQLGILPQQLIPLLSKVTAVAGGNAQAIEDIVSAIGGVSEAAKAAGLNIDQQIAAVQVLSQVTNKTAADVATSFKNLFGSLSSVGAAKALGKFGIDTRTATGEMRDFLDVYKDVYDARQAGRISEGQLSDVLKGISGGPRRAPDAAALLANIPLIFETIEKSTNATNEALIANARILDTNSAKLQQIRTKFDAALIQNFTDAVNSLVKVFYDLGSAIGDLGDESGLILLIGQLAFLTIGLGAAGKGIQLFGRAFTGLRNELRALTGISGLTGTFLDKYINPTRGAVTKLTATRAPLLTPPPLLRYPTLTYTPTNRPLTISRPTPVPYLSTLRPVATPPRVPGTPNPVGNREYRRSAAGRAEIAAALRGQLPLPPSNAQIPLSTVNPATGLKPLTQQLKEEVAYRKQQLANNVSYLKARLGQETGYIKTRILQEAEYRGVQLAEEATFTKAQIAQSVAGGKARLSQEISFRKQQVANTISSLKQQAQAEASYKKGQLLGTGKGRLLVGAGIGAAVAGGLAAVGGATDSLDALATAGQGIGVTLALLGGPVGIGAGVTLVALSSAMQLFNEEQKKAAELSKGLRTAVFDNIKTLEEERAGLVTSQTAMDESKKTIDELSTKKKLNADETNRLETAQKTYVDSLFQVSAGNSQVLETTNKLIQQIPQLESKFTSLANTAKGGILSPGALLDLQAALAGDILGIGGVPNLPRQPLRNNPREVTLLRDQGNASIPSSLDNDVRLNAIQNSKPVGTSKEVVDAINKGGYDYVRKLLDTSKAGPFDNVYKNGFVLDQSVLDAVQSALSTVEDKSNADFQASVEEFGKWVFLVGSQQAQLSTYISGSQAAIQAKVNLGILRGTEASNALGRSAIGGALQSTIPTVVQREQQYSATPHGAQEFDTPSLLKKIEDYLYGPNGLLTDANVGKEVTANQARLYISLLKEIDPVYSDLIEGSKEFDAAAYKAFADKGILIDELAKAAQGATDAFDELRASIEDSIESGTQDLAKKMLDLQAARAGLTTDKNKATTKEDKTAAIQGLTGNSQELGQTRELIKLYQQLGGTIKNNVPILDEFKQQLRHIHGLEAIQLVDNKDLLPTLVNYAQQLGLTGKQVDAFSRQLKTLADNLAAFNQIKSEWHLKADVDVSAALRYFKLLKSLSTVQIAPGVPVSVPGGGGQYDAIIAQLTAIGNSNASSTSGLNRIISSGGSVGRSPSGGGGSKPSGSGPVKPSLLDIPEEFKNSGRSVADLLREAVRNAKGLQRKVPGETKDNKRDIVEILNGTKRVLEVRGVGEEYLRRAMDELAEQIKKQNDLLAKADTIRRIRVGAGDFAAIANVPINSKTGISLGGSNAINVTLNLNGTVLTPAQFEQFANQIGAAIKRQIVQGG